MARQCSKEKCVVDSLQVCDDCTCVIHVHYYSLSTYNSVVQMMYSVRDRARVVHSANVNKNVW